MNEKVSIIIPIYNTENYLKECLDTVINQTYKNLEIILINDGSTDKSLDICKEYKRKDKRIILIDKENTGVSNTRNIGIEAATGSYITFVDADDIVELDAIETMVNCISKEKTDVVRTNFAINNETGKIPSKVEGKIEKENINKLLRYFLNAKIPAYMCLFLIKKDILDKNNIRLNEKLVMMEDTLFFVTLIQKVNSIYILNKKTYNYRVYQESSSNSLKRIEKNIKSVLLVNEEINKIISDEELIEVTNRTEFRIICDFIIKMYKNNHPNISSTLKYLNKNTNLNRMINNLNYKKLNKDYKKMYKGFKRHELFRITLCYKDIVFREKMDEIMGVLRFKANRIYNKYIKIKK